MVGLDGFEPSTSRLSGVRSYQTELQARIQRRSYDDERQRGNRPIRMMFPETITWSYPFWTKRPSSLIEPIMRCERTLLDLSKPDSDSGRLIIP